MTDDLQLLRDFRSDVAPPDDSTLTQVYDRLVVPPRRGRWLVRLRLRRPGLAIAVATTTLVVVGAAGALAIHLTGPSPGFTAGVSAIETLPQTPLPASVPQGFIDSAARHEGVSTSEFEQRMRRLRMGLTLGPGRSRGEGELYAYVGKDGAACIFLTGQGGQCFNSRMAPNFPGVTAMLLPGYPGQTPAVVAIVADNVKAVTLSLGDRRLPLAIVNNSVYADLDGLQAGDVVALHATYDDGTCRTTRLVNPKGGALRAQDQPEAC